MELSVVIRFCALLIVLSLECRALAQPQQLTIRLRDGSCLSLAVDQDGFMWREVDGNLGNKKMLWKDVRQLTLVESSVGTQVERIEKLLKQLTNESYLKREQAESQLRQIRVAGPFLSVIRSYMKNTTEPEAVHRLRRILVELEESDQDFVAEFDKLELKNMDSDSANRSTSRLSGDAIDFVIEGTAFGNKVLQFDRKQILGVSTAPKAHGKLAETATPVNVQTFNKIGKAFYQSDDPMLSFETDVNGNAITIGNKIDDVFMGAGLRMRTENAGFIHVIKYPFKFCPIEAGDRCVCPYDANLDKPLRGASLLTFCVPGQPSVAAGVYKFGVFLESIEHSRDFVVEAYNHRGQMIGMVEATDQICVFAGFQSNEPIVKIRIARNQSLPDLERELDETYAFDCVTFEEPIVVPELMSIPGGNLRTPAGARVNFASGDELTVQKTELHSDRFEYLNPFTNKWDILDWKEVDSVAFSQAAETRHRGGLPTMLQLSDGSIVHVDPTSALSSYDFVGHEFEKRKVVGLWSGTCRYPRADLVTKGKPVIVYPGCQIVADDVSLLPDGFRWNKETSTKHVQTVVLNKGFDPFERMEDPDPDLTPTVSRVRFPDGSSNPAGDSYSSWPSLWFSQPKTTPRDYGHVHLFDGQYFVLGGESGFKVNAIDNAKRMIVMQLGEYTKSYPLSRIRSISLRSR